MGLTIHWSLKTDGRKTVDTVKEIFETLKKRAMDLPFAEVGEVVHLSGDECDFEKRRGEDEELVWSLIQAAQHVNFEDHSSVTVPPTEIVFLNLWPGEGCEPVNIGLAKYPKTVTLHDGKEITTRLNGWSWSSFCKTQYANNPKYGGAEHFARCHLAVVKLLDVAVELGIVEDVRDEGDYWETRDLDTLMQCVGSSEQEINATVDELLEVEGAK